MLVVLLKEKEGLEVFVFFSTSLCFRLGEVFLLAFSVQRPLVGFAAEERWGTGGYPFVHEDVIILSTHEEQLSFRCFFFFFFFFFFFNALFFPVFCILWALGVVYFCFLVGPLEFIAIRSNTL